MGLVLGVLLFSPRERNRRRGRGRRLLAAGFGLLLLGQLLRLAQGLEILALPGTSAALLENLAGYGLGGVLLAAGVWHWMPRRRTLAVERDETLDSEIEELFKGVFENSPSAIFVKDIDGYFRIVSRRFEDWYGIPAKDAFGKKSHELFPDVFANAYVAQDADVLRQRHVVEREQEIVFQDGSTHDILVTKFPVLDEEGEPIGIGTINTDLTAYKQALAALRESEAVLADAQALAKVGNWRWDTREDRLVSCSKEYARIHGVRMEEIHDLMVDHTEQVVHPDDRLRVDRDFKNWVRESQDYEFGYRIVRPDGEVRHVRELGMAARDEAGRAVEYVGTLQDITEQKRFEEELMAAKEAAELADRAKSEFLANMSHELRTPLNMVIGFAQLIEGEKTGAANLEKHREYAADIQRAGKHLLDMIVDILDLSRIESGDLSPHDTELEIGDLVRCCLKLVEERAERAGVEISTDLSAGEPYCLTADSRMIKRVLINLLSNGIKFTPHGGSVRVTGLYDPDGSYRLQISDTGIGIASEDIGKALGRFQQVDGQLNRKHEGSGLGLPLSKSLIEVHGGKLALESKIGEGTTVTVYLPAERIAPFEVESEPKADRL